jgi:serine/threonine protein kinase
VPVPLDCPGAESWQALLASALSPEDQERYERHLEACPACRERLERLATFGDQFVELARQTGDPTVAAADPTLVQVVDRLLRAKADAPGPGEVPDLDFLGPADLPGLLGTLGSYEVEEVIGQGGMGVVLRAFDPALQRHVAIKVLAPALAASATARQRFTREAQAAAAVRHDHVVTVHGVYDAEGLPYLVMQYVPGESLQTRLDRTGPLGLEDIVRVGLQTASGLAAAHALGLIHRDIKPANLLLEGDPARVKITDFGLARAADDVSLTQSGVVAGTPEYMAPEQARAEPVDHRADLFSLGSVLYALAAGRSPFRGPTALSVLRQVSDEPPPPLRELNQQVPAWLEAFIARLLAKDPTRRFQSAAEVAALLEGYLAHLRQPATVPPPALPSVTEESPGTGRPGVRGWWRSAPWALAAVAVTALLLGTWLLGQVPPGSGQEPGKEFYQDFRGRRPLSPSLTLVGPDAEEVFKPEAEGLRVTLPATRPVNYPVAVATTFALTGDFEITGTYELLSATQPASGYGVGVSLNLADDDARKKFAKAGRILLPTVGSVFEAQHWTNEPHSYQEQTRPTDSRVGQLRLVRKGSSLRYLAADGLTGDFQEVGSQENFGTDDLNHVHFEVSDSGKPGNAVDFRLVDLRIRSTNALAAAAAEPPAPAEAPPAPAAARGSRRGVGILGLVLVAALAVALAVRQQRRKKVPAPAETGTGGMAVARGTNPGLGLLSSVATPILLLLAAAGVSTALLFVAAPEAPPGLHEFYHDFRGGGPLPTELALEGGDADEMAHPEAGGLRVTMPATRRRSGPVGVATTFPVTGDFEITGTYELLSADQPPRGNGVGVALNIATDPDLDHFAKLGRFRRLQNGHVFVMESWNGRQHRAYRNDFVPTEVRTGQLRLAREGSTLRYLVNDEPGGEFRALSRAEFPADDLTLCRFVVNNSGSPAGVDARLLDLRIRYGANVAVPAPRARGWLAAVETLILVVCLVAVGAWLVVPRPRGVGKAPAAAAAPPDPAEPVVACVSFRCPGCGKSLRARTELGGKRVKCSGCGQPVRVPSVQAGGAAASPS